MANPPGSAAVPGPIRSAAFAPHRRAKPAPANPCRGTPQPRRGLADAARLAAASVRAPRWVRWLRARPHRRHAPRWLATRPTGRGLRLLTCSAGPVRLAPPPHLWGLLQRVASCRHSPNLLRAQRSNLAFLGHGHRSAPDLWSTKPARRVALGHDRRRPGRLEGPKRRRPGVNAPLSCGPGRRAQSAPANPCRVSAAARACGRRAPAAASARLTRSGWGPRPPQAAACEPTVAGRPTGRGAGPCWLRTPGPGSALP